MKLHIAVLPGDGIGPEVVEQAFERNEKPFVKNSDILWNIKQPR